MEDGTLSLSRNVLDRISAGRLFLEEKIAKAEQPYYGINTGFGSLCDVEISGDDIEQLQYNLVCSHACGTGDIVPDDIVKLMLLLKIINLSGGYSGVRPAVVQLLVDMYNTGIYPLIYQQGSLGASGDLAPLAHLSLPLIGEGRVKYRGRVISSSEAFEQAGLNPIDLKAKEGLALLNGTQFSTAYALWAVIEASRMAEVADLCAALSVDVFQGQLSPFDIDLHEIRPHAGQKESAAAIRRWLTNSGLRPEKPVAVQDPYSFRCVPQVHGAVRDTIAYAAAVVLTEVNAVTDNPSIFPDEDKIISGGNFHAQPIAFILDFLAIALCEFGSISERRTYKLTSGKRGLPDFLIKTPGLHSGFMIPQYTAASIVSQNKQLATPASVDSIVSSAGQEDHVSMAANAATKCYTVVNNCWQVLGIEWMCAAQALDLRRPLKTSPQIEARIEPYRSLVSTLEKDRVLSDDMQKSALYLRRLDF